MIKPFIVSVPDSTLEEIYNKIKNYPWKEMPNLDGWEYGSNLNYIKDFSKYWISNFDWKKQEAEINKFSNFITNVDDIDIHFIKEKGSGSSPMPLLILHGWPGSDSRVSSYNRKTCSPRKIWWKRGRCF